MKLSLMREDLVALALFAGWLALNSLVGKIELPAAEVTAQIAAERDAEVRARSMPPADPIFERPLDLLRLTLPVSCTRYEGVEGMGREWIRSWGDGAYRPTAPTCVRAS